MASLYRILSTDEPNVKCTVPCNGTCIVDLCLSSPPPTTTDDYIHLNNANHHLLPLVIIPVVSILAVFFFLLLTYYTLRLRRRRRLRSSDDPSSIQPHTDDGFFEEGDGDHHVWYIRTVGLDVPTINSIAVCVYKAGDGLIESSDCSVCLGEFCDGELVRLLPKCSHAFHLPCIDTWLGSHVNCPLCRAHIVDPIADPGNCASSSSLDTSSSDVAENLQSGVELTENDRMVSEEEMEESGIEIVIDPVSSVSPSFDSELRVPSDLGEGVMQPVRRSVSMDASTLGALLLMGEPDGRSGEERKEANFEKERATKNRGKHGNTSKAAALQKGPLGMERSMSSSGPRFFLSRYGRVRNSILPL